MNEDNKQRNDLLEIFIPFQANKIPPKITPINLWCVRIDSIDGFSLGRFEQPS